MAVTAQKSTQVTNEDATPAVLNPVYNSHARKRVRYFKHTQSGAGDATSTVELVRLPAGKVRLFANTSLIGFTAFGAARTLDIGWKAYTADDDTGTAVVADPNGIDNAVDVSAAGVVIPDGDGVSSLGTGRSKLFESRDGITIQATVAGGTIPDATVLEGTFEYSVD